MADQLSRTKLWFEQAVPFPQGKNQQVQLGVHLEEVVEMLQCFIGTTGTAQDELMAATRALNALANNLKSGSSVLRLRSGEGYDVALLDGLCDQLVTGVGVAHMYGLNILGAMEEVNNSNFSKFVDGQPAFDANGKIQKGPGYFKPNLAPFV